MREIINYRIINNSKLSINKLDDIKNLKNIVFPIIATFADSSSFIGPIWADELESVLPVLKEKKVYVTLYDADNNLLDEYNKPEEQDDTNNISWR